MADTAARDRNTFASRIVRYADLVPCLDAFIDTRTPGSDKKENFTIIGPGVSENPNQHVHIAEPHGLNIGGARQPPGCTNSQHSHETAEVFYVHSGQWRFDLGETGGDAQVELGPGDLISIPTGVFRGFANIGTETGFLFAILGEDDPGRVLWAPQVFEMAEQYGLILLDDGMLIDTAKGEIVPAGKSPMPVTTEAQVADLKVFNHEQLEACVTRVSTSCPSGDFSRIHGVSERVLIGRGQLDWAHGFSASEICLVAGATVPAHALDVTDIWFVQSGQAQVTIGENIEDLTTGDTVTLPRAITRSLKNTSNDPVILLAVRGGDAETNVRWT